MIITDSAPPSPVAKSPTGQTTITSPSSRAGPAFSSSSQPLLPPPAYAESCDSREMGEPAGRRFVKAFLCAIGVYLLLAWFIGSATIDITPEINYPWGPPPEPEAADGVPINCHIPFDSMRSGGIDPLPWVGEVVFTNDTDVALQQGGGIGRTTPPYWSRTDFTLPALAPLHFFFARGSLASGLIKIKLAGPNDEDDSEQIHGTVVTHYWSIQARDRANLCTLKKEEGSYGFGIYTPTGWPIKTEDLLHFEITLTIPPRDLSTVYGSLHTDFSTFTHDIGDLKQGLSLKDVNFASTNSPIRVDSIQTQTASVRTTNAPISGYFNVTDSASIVTTNGRIDVQILAINKDWHKPTNVYLKTTNALLKGDLRLLSSESATYGRKRADTGLKAVASTTNGNLNLAVTTAPVDSHLQIEASTSNSNAQLDLPPAFEGKLSLKTSGYNDMTILNADAHDPSGRGRRRVFTTERRARGALEGRVWWAPEKEARELSSASLKTSNGDSVVRLL